MSQKVHWRDRAISGLSIISDGFEVFKAAGAHIAEWVLWFCLVANLLEMFPLPLPSWYGVTVIAIQSVMLDVAGFGLTSMAASAKRRGDLESAKKGGRMGMALIIIMMLTVGLITLSVLVPATKPYVDWTDKLMILARMVVTVFYGHIVDEMKKAGVAHENRLAELQTEVDTLKKERDAKQQEVSSIQEQLAIAQKAITDLQVQHNKENEAARVEIESLRGKLDIKAREVEMMQADQAGVIDLRRELTSVKIQFADLQTQLDAKQQALQNEQIIASNLRREVERLQQNEAKIEAAKQRSEALRSTQNEAPKRSTEAKKRSSEALVVPGIVRLPLNTDRAALKAEALRLIDEENKSTYQASEITKIPAGTIQRWLSERKNTAQLQMDGEAREA